MMRSDDLWTIAACFFALACKIIVIAIFVTCIGIWLGHYSPEPNPSIESIETSHAINERSETERLAEKYEAEAEVMLADRTRVDLLSDTHAIEVEWAENMYEAPGQATWYSIVTGKKPGVILLVRDAKRDARHIARAVAICKKLDIEIWLEPASNYAHSSQAR